jgi:hypothetical protein
LESCREQPLFGFSGTDPPLLRSAGLVNALELLFYAEKQIPCDSIQRVDLTPYPVAANFDVDWLGVKRGDEALFDEDEDDETSHSIPIRTLAPTQIERESDMELASSKRVFSYELQILYRTMRGILIGEDPLQCEQMLGALRHKAYLQGLLPDCIRFAQQIIRDSPRSYSKLYVAASMARAMCGNSGLVFLDSYLPQIMTIGLSILLSSNLLPRSLYELSVLQEYAADLIRVLVERVYEHVYVLVQPRLTEQLVSTVVMSENMVEKAGAITGLRYLGLETVSGYVLPACRGVLGRAEQLCSENEAERRDLGKRVYELELKSVGSCLHADTYKMTALGFFPFDGYSREMYREMLSIFGSDLMQYVVDDSSFLYL